MNRATATLEAIRDAINADSGAAFRVWQGKVLPHMGDAYSGEREDGKRTHLGASVIGKECARAIWLDFRWAGDNEVQDGDTQAVEDSARMQRLWNRGHLEEGRFIAMLLTIGVKVIQQEKDGRQMRFSDYYGHYSGSMDGAGLNIPDVPPGAPALLEFKTYNDKRFKELVNNGVEFSDPTYYVQCQQYMGKRNLKYTLFMAVNKNDETLHAEILTFDNANYGRYRDRAIKIVMADEPPMKINNASLGYYKCRFCDRSRVCHGVQAPAVNCRTCVFASPEARSDANGKGVWNCRKLRKDLSKEEQRAGCGQYHKIPQL